MVDLYEQIKIRNRVNKCINTLLKTLDDLPCKCENYAHYSGNIYYISAEDIRKCIEKTREELLHELIPESN